MPNRQQPQRRKGKLRDASKCSQQELKLNGHQYVHKSLTLEMHVVAQQQLLQAAQKERLAAGIREQLLIDMVLHQDLLLDHAHWVQQQQQECWQKHACVTTGEMDTRCAPHSCGAGVTESVRQAPAAAAPDAAAVGSRLGFGGTSSEECSYIERLLRTATAEQLERALTWGVEDWRMYWRSTFTRMTGLLELVKREIADAAEAADAPQPLRCNAGCQCGAGNCQTASWCPWSLPAAAADSLSPAAAAAATQPGPYMKCLYDTVDEVMTLSFLGNIHNPMTMFQAAVCNMETGELGTPPPQHRVLVARRMQLTPLQVEHLAVALHEFERLSKAHCQEGNTLIIQANQPGWIFGEAVVEAGRTASSSACASAATEAQNRLAGSAAATAASSSSADAGGASAATGSSSATSSSGGLDLLLGRHVRARHLHMMSLHMVISNTLSRLQLAHLHVASYPWGPVATAVSEAVAMASAPAAAAKTPPEQRSPSQLQLLKLQHQHEAARTAILAKQQQRWWQEVGDSPHGLGGALQRQLMLQLLP